MTENIQIKHNGSWTPVKQIFVKKDGVWHPATEVYQKTNGFWYRSHAAEGSPAPIAYYNDWVTFPFITGYLTVNSVSQKLLDVQTGSESGDGMIHMYDIGDFNPLTYKYIIVKYKLVTPVSTTMQIYYTNTSYPLANEIQVRSVGLNSDTSKWHYAVFDMSGHPRWNLENIKGWRLDPVSTINTRIQIEFIALSKIPNISQFI